MATTTCALPAELTIYTIGELHAQCLAWTAADTADDLAVAADGVAEVDAAGVQLLFSLQRTLAGKPRALRLVAPSAPLRAALASLGADTLARAMTDREGALV